MFLLLTRLPPRVAGIAIVLAHLAVLVDVATRRDLPWWRRLVTAVVVGALLPLGALVYLLLRPTGERMRARVTRRTARHPAESWSGRRLLAARIARVAGVVVALVASVVASAAAAPTPTVSSAASPSSPFDGEDYGVDLLGLRTAWRTGTGAGVTVAVVDSGVDAANAFLAPRLVPGHDLADGTGSTADGLGHGTHVAGIVAQAAPDARIMPVKVLDAVGHADLSTISAGVRWAADHGAQVINLSVDESGVLAQVQKEGSLNDAARYANSRGSVVISAAGNDATHLQVYRSGIPVITVAAVDSSSRPASFTNWGGSAEVAGPGVDIWSTAPTAPTTLFPQGTDGTGSLSGTSMATPFVSGVAAVLRGHGATAAATEQALLSTARPVPGTSVLGHGLVDAPAALSYAAAHPNPRVALAFAPRWFRWVEFALLVAVAAKYAWVAVRWLRRRRRPGVAPAAAVPA